MKDYKKYSPVASFLIALFCLAMLQGCGINNSTENNVASFSDLSNGSVPSADDSKLTDEQQALYREDAEILAMRYTNAKDSTQTALPQSLINSVYNGLIHIVISGQQGVNEFTDDHPVHARNRISAHEILVFADSTAAWLDAWKNGGTESGNAEVDDLVNRFELTLVNYNELSSTLPTTMATLRAAKAYNMFAVSRLFKEIPDIDHAEPNTSFTDGNDISVLFFDDHLRFTFDYGFGDCPSGCINHHYWKYNVFRDGSVEFIKEEGAPL